MQKKLRKTKKKKQRQINVLANEGEKITM